MKLAVLGTCVAVFLIVAFAVWRTKRRSESATHIDTPLELRTVRGFLTDEECDGVRRAALAKGLSRSTVVRTNQPSSIRTSSTTFLTEADAPVVRMVFDKVSALLDVSVARMENLQVVRYLPGEKYEAHYDPCFRCNKNGGDLLREFTVLMYLNDDFEGGHTDFPLAGRSVRPERGMAAVFKNMVDGRIVRESKHRGAPPTVGTKWVCTVWVRPE